MPSQSDDENSDSNTEFKVNNEYAKNYNQWRQKEELHKLKQRYGEEACNLDNLSDNSSSDTSEDDDEVEVSEKFENDFFKVLAYLKSEDPKIHDEKISFFNNTKEDLEEGRENRKKKGKKEKAVTLRDFERKIILERGGKYSDSEDESKPQEQHENRLTYVQEQNEIKNSFKAALEDDEEDGNLLVVKEKTEEQIRKEEKRKKWLKGQEVDDVDPQDEVLKPIRDFWANPNLDAGEKFLRDYILDKKYQDKNASAYDRDYDHMVHDSDENLSEDEQNIERQEEFEYKYNFRFEEPDQDFIKRYPRTLENSLRKKDTRRSEKRADLKKRKDDEKLRKKEELKELKALKRKEIEEKLEKLKEITGNEDFGIRMEDLEGDFDPNEYDQKMKKMFDDDFYTVAEDDMKPQFPEIDEEIKDFDNYGENFEEDGEYYDEGPNCEDENFIMDADYDPTAEAKSKKVDSKKKKKGRNKNVELPKEKPKFDPEIHSSYQEYIDRYYALDYEDMIGDIPCRFKLRKSIPNNYGLTIEEILLADDKELNKWCSLKKALEFKSEETEKNEIFKFQQKAKNEALKKKILKSVYSPEEETEEQEATVPTEQTKKKRRKKKKGKATENVSNPPEPSTSAEKQNNLQISKPMSTKSEKRKHSDVFTEKTEDTASKKIKQNQNKSTETPDVINQVEKVPNKKKKKAAQQEISNDSKSETIVKSESKPVNNTQIQNKKKKMKNKAKTTLNSSVQSGISEADSNETAKQTENVGKKKKEKNQNNISVTEVKEVVTDNNNEDNKSEKYEKIMRKKENRKRKLEKKQKYLKLKNKLQKKESNENPLNQLSADRLRAFGTNPKKFKNRLKYGNKNTVS